jgi:serine/threonine-protein kinase RsbT
LTSFRPPAEIERLSLVSQNSIVSTGAFDAAVSVHVMSPVDIVEARQRARVMAQDIGCSTTQATLVATVISELARNIILHAGDGDILLGRIDKLSQRGLRIVAIDKGPGIHNISRAMARGFSTSGGLGLGLPGVREIADSFNVVSKLGQGTRIEVVMWLAES